MSNPRRYVWTALISLLIAPLLSHSQVLPELLLPVDPKALDGLLSKSNYGLRRQLYVAKRYRIVQIDFSVLDRPGVEFTITPFDDLQMTVAAKQTRGPSSGGQWREWLGDLVIPGAIVTDSEGRVVEDWPFVVNLQIRTGDHEVPVKLIRKIAAERGDKNEFGPLPDISGAPPETGGNRVSTRLSLRTILGEWWLPANPPTRIVIQPVEDDPRYHVIYEEDQDKMAHTIDTPSEDTTRKLERAREFARQLEEERAKALAEANPDNR